MAPRTGQGRGQGKQRRRKLYGKGCVCVRGLPGAEPVGRWGAEGTRSVLGMLDTQGRDLPVPTQHRLGALSVAGACVPGMMEAPRNSSEVHWAATRDSQPAGPGHSVQPPPRAEMGSYVRNTTPHPFSPRVEGTAFSMLFHQKLSPQFSSS